jgi:CheY-like chemotaxis protein
MDQKIILLVEDNPNDEALALRALKKHTIRNAVVMHDGVEALKYLFGTGVYASCDLGAISRVILLDLKPPQRGMER